MEWMIWGSATALFAWTYLWAWLVGKRKKAEEIQRIDTQFGVLKLKRIAGNITTDDWDWARRNASRPEFAVRKDLAIYRAPPQTIRQKRKAKKVADELMSDYRHLRELSEKNAKTNFFPKPSDYKSCRQVDAELQEDKKYAVSCIDMECNGTKTRDELEKIK